ncbi:MAG: MBL fold metallo-hydrolase [Planctomycetes bacterium]|nr:MBL fold metallo-hydrolase [Planctomycetota bacterium]
MSEPCRDPVRAAGTRRRPCALLVGLLLGIVLISACANPRPVADRSAGIAVYVLGRAQDGGLPHLGCEREACCAAARRSGRIETPACLGIHDEASGALWLIEATPAIEAQVARLHSLTGTSARGRRPIDGVLVTHAHLGHYLGLAWLGREVAATSALPLFVSERFAEYLRTNGPWRQLVELGQVEPRPFAPGGRFTLRDGLEVEAIAVPHRDEFSDTVAFKLRGPTRTVLFCPDVDAWDRHDGLLERLLDDVDVAYLDATFYDGRELPERVRAEIPHPPMVDTMTRLAAFAASHPGAIRFIHLNHTNPAWNDAALRVSIEARGFSIAEPGERVRL